MNKFLNALAFLILLSIITLPIMVLIYIDFVTEFKILMIPIIVALLVTWGSSAINKITSNLRFKTFSYLKGVWFLFSTYRSNKGTLGFK